MIESNDERAGCSSPPYFMDEAGGLSLAQAPAELSSWRRSQRNRLVAERLALDPAIRCDYSQRIAQNLDRVLGDPAELIVSGYWPHRGEPDLRGWLATLAQRKGQAALPVIVAKGEPLSFRGWRPGERLEKGIWNIPFPAEGPYVNPDIVIAPLVGFDVAGYRLGHGGGYFDRTLASVLNRPHIIIGVGYGQSKLSTIYPQPHDVPMDIIVTESEIAEFRR